MLFKAVVSYLFRGREVVEFEAMNVASAKRQITRRYGSDNRNGGLHHSLVSVTLLDDEDYIVCQKVHSFWEYPYRDKRSHDGIGWVDWCVGERQKTFKYQF